MSFRQNIAEIPEQLKTQGHNLSFTHSMGAVAQGYCTSCGAAFTVVKLGQRHRTVGISAAHPCGVSLKLDDLTLR